VLHRARSPTAKAFAVSSTMELVLGDLQLSLLGDLPWSLLDDFQWRLLGDFKWSLLGDLQWSLLGGRAHREGSV
jgi:hypothetical protein